MPRRRSRRSTSQLVDGPEDHHRFGDPDEQGPRTDRGASSVCAADPTRSTSLVHPQSVIHGLVEFRDGSVIAQLGAPDMRIPIAHCLAWPERIDGAGRAARSGAIANADLRGARSGAVPGACACPRRRWRPGGGAPTVLNAANEVAVAEFLGRGSVLPGFGAGRGHAGSCGRGAACCGNRQASRMRSPLTMMRRSLARDLLPEIAAKAS